MKYIEDSTFKQAIDAYARNKEAIAKLQKENIDIENYILDKFCDIDLNSDAKGTEELMLPDGSEGFEIEHKLTTKVDMNKALDLLHETGEFPEHFFNVKYDYSARVAKLLSTEEQQKLNDCLITKRAKSSFTLKENN